MLDPALAEERAATLSSRTMRQFAATAALVCVILGARAASAGHAGREWVRAAVTVAFARSGVVKIPLRGQANGRKGLRAAP